MNALEAIKNRRSCRQYIDKDIPEEILDQIIQAGRYAPSGGNSKTTKILVFKDKKIIHHIEQIAQEEFRKYEIIPNMYKSLKSSILQSQKGNYHFTFGAPILIVLVNKKEYGNGMADCVAMTENMLIAATALNISSCYVNQIHWLTNNQNMRNYLSQFGLNKDEMVYSSLVLGYSNQSYPKREDKGNEVYIY